MDPILEFQKLVGSRAAYPVIAAIVTFALQIGKVSPYTKVLYAKTPIGWRWLMPVIVGAAMGFAHGFQMHYTVVGSLVEMVFGMFGVGVTSMGLHAGLLDSPLPWGDTGPGGVSKSSDTDP
jgi:hypothetical protein